MLKAGDRVVVGDDVVNPAWRGTIIEVRPCRIAGEDHPMYKIQLDNGLDGVFGPELIMEVKSS